MAGPTLHGPGEGERLAMGPTEIVIKADGEATGGTLFLSETIVAPGFPGPPPHRHRELHDMFYVLEGTLTMLVAGQTREVRAGSFACVPPGEVHTFSNPGAAPVRFLNFSTPSGFEGYMRELAAAGQAGPLSSQEIGRIASRYDFEVA